MKKVKQSVKQNSRSRGEIVETGQIRAYFNEPRRTRTSNLLIKSQLLCQLS